MTEKQKEFKKIVPECPKCKHLMHERSYDNTWEKEIYQKKYRCEEDDAIQNKVVEYHCYNCNTHGFVLQRTQSQRLDDEILEIVVPEPEPHYHYVETVYDLPEKAEKWEFFLLKKGYYDFAHYTDGKWTFSKNYEGRKRCEDCIYFVSNYTDIEIGKQNPEKNGAPCGHCKQNFRMKDDCPIWDNGGE